MKDEEFTGIGKAIRARREELRISAGELARRAGVHASSILRLESGEFTAGKLDTVAAIATALAVPLTELLATSNLIGEDDLPRLIPYLRTKYKGMPDVAIREIEQHFNAVAKRHGIRPNNGPDPGQDE
ncbi:helix-turn-helix domain-containing protein [Arthrobacter sp. RAF14]|uniref:helix-turn-helix domain-containing protein n=1 Tax=Arthrobacter sp. RAF14 TaxID=3233051 RepID=UPI003F8E6A51